MSINTLSPHRLTEAVISVLNTDAGVLAVTDNINEANWMSLEYSYPCIRVDMGALPEEIPVNGNCEGTLYDFNLSIHVFTEESSSKSCQQLMGLVGKALQGKNLSNAYLHTLALKIRYVYPMADGANAWRGEVYVYSKLQSLES